MRAPVAAAAPGGRPAASDTRRTHSTTRWERSARTASRCAASAADSYSLLVWSTPSKAGSYGSELYIGRMKSQAATCKNVIGLEKIPLSERPQTTNWRRVADSASMAPVRRVGRVPNLASPASLGEVADNPG